jgi:hypothetical protein
MQGDQGGVVSATDIRLGINLDVVCGGKCETFARPLYEQMSSGRYDLCSVVNLQPIEDWRADHRTARKRADRAERRGYRFAWVNRAHFNEDIHEINTSAAYRQGRPMTDSYQQFKEYAPLPLYWCRRHAIRTYGVLKDNRLVAYLWLYRVGELALVSQILGHADHLENEVMYLLMQGVMTSEYACDPHGYLVYNRHDSGTDGLRFYKERCGFVEMGVEWLA